ncbi:MAG: hypothetical protein GY725_25050 [bacterium]|nr:hypothetical protein [bacterium]
MLCLIFAMSGASALAFEALFFRLAGLVLGNSVWAVSIVLCSFMAGLSLGSAVAGRVGDGLRAPLRMYALAELAIAASGVGLVALLPGISASTAGFLGTFADSPALLGFLRLSGGFALLVVPAAAMGTTLPLLVRALSARDPNYGRTLGRLYGWNTFGAVIGVIVTERWMIGALGVTGSAVAAGALNLLAGLGALWLARGGEPQPADSAVRAQAVALSRAWPISLGAFASGAVMMALEVVWFRLFLLFTEATGWNLALMLATVLTGISLGGLASSLWFRFDANAHTRAGLFGIANALLLGLSYAGLGMGIELAAMQPPALAYAYMMLPVSIGSGVLFPLLGRALQASGIAEARATAHVAVINTLGGAVGSLLGAFVLIPQLGVERSLFVLLVVYGLVGALLLLHPIVAGSDSKARTAKWLWAVGLLGGSVLVFPFGAMNEVIIRGSGTFYQFASDREMELVAVREGVTETAQIFRKDVEGKPWFYTLATNNHSMSSTMTTARRYMKLYVYWPMAVRPETRSALLISYGVGSTAKALVDTQSLKTIDIVDISSDILELSEYIYPDPADHPLRDPRVEVHVEDGRFFLASTERRFDLITAEPPPPRNAGIENLFSQEFFELARARLSDRGIVTYWLPVHSLRVEESKSILRGFCNVFENCSLWAGSGRDWMMVGINQFAPTGPVSVRDFSRQWRDDRVAPELRDLGLLSPDQLGATFIADAQGLADWIGDAAALDDQHPHRIDPRNPQDADDDRAHYALLMSRESQSEFSESTDIAAIWPAPLREAAGSWFPAQRLVDLLIARIDNYAILHMMLSDPRLSPYLPWALESSSDSIRLIESIDDEAVLSGSIAVEPETYRHLAARSLRAHAFGNAATFLARSTDTPERVAAAFHKGEPFTEIYLLLRATLNEKALQRMRTYCRIVRARPLEIERARRFWNWAKESVGFEYPFERFLSGA